MRESESDVDGPETVCDLDPDRTVFVGSRSGGGRRRRAHLHRDDADACRFSASADLRAVLAAALDDDHPVCAYCVADDGDPVDERDYAQDWGPQIALRNAGVDAEVILDE